MGLPEGWITFGNNSEVISDYARYKAIGNAIAVPCAEYIMAGISETL
jgi:DNA (cytosine-5)-methyltransferase 1